MSEQQHNTTTRVKISGVEMHEEFKFEQIATQIKKNKIHKTKRMKTSIWSIPCGNPRNTNT